MSKGVKSKQAWGAPKWGNAFLPPAIQALLIQLVSLVFSLALLVLFNFVLLVPPSLYFIVFAQAAFAAFFSFICGMDWWWWVIQFFFPIFAIIFVTFEIPSHYYFIAFVFLGLLYWTTFRTQVPYYPSKPALLPVVLRLLDGERPVRFVDVGSGLGGLLIQLSEVRDDSHFVGIEIAPLPWLISWVRAKIRKSKVQFVFGNYESADFGEYDVVFAYLSPAVMPGLWIKVKEEMSPGSLLLSFEFLIPDIKPDLCVKTAVNEPNLYVWRI